MPIILNPCQAEDDVVFDCSSRLADSFMVFYVTDRFGVLDLADLFLINKWLHSSEVLSALPVSTVFDISMAASRILSRVTFHLVSGTICVKGITIVKQMVGEEL